MPTRDLGKSKQLKAVRKKILLEMLGGECVRCSSTDRLEFDHIDPGTISFRIGHRLDYSVKTLFAEASKCQLLCKTCHMQKTLVDRKLKPAVHGVLSRYMNQRCRCSLCKEANATYQRERRKRILIINWA